MNSNPLIIEKRGNEEEKERERREGERNCFAELSFLTSPFAGDTLAAGYSSLPSRPSDYLRQARPPSSACISLRHFLISTTLTVEAPYRNVNKNTLWRTARAHFLSGRTRIRCPRHGRIARRPENRKNDPLVVDPRGPRDHTNRSLFFLRLLPRTRANITRLFRDTRTSGRPQQPSVGRVEETRLINEDGRHLSAPAAAVVLGRFADPRRRRVGGGERRAEGLESSAGGAVAWTPSKLTGARSEQGRRCRGANPPVASPTPTPMPSGGCCLLPRRRRRRSCSTRPHLPPQR